MTDKNTKNMTVGDPKRIIIAFAIPICLSQLFQQLYNSVDSIIVGNYLGKEALAAVSSSGTLIFLLVSFFTGTAMGAGVIISRYFGAGDHEKMSRVIHTNVALGLVSGIFLSIFGVLATPTILRWMGVAPEVLPESISYFRNYFMGVLSVVMYNICTGIMNAVGDSRRPLYYLIFSSLLNVVLDLLFVGVLGFGVGSAAIATIISQSASVVLCLIHLLKKGTVYQIQIKKIRFHADMVKEIIKFGLPTGVQNSVIALANVLVQTNVNSFGGDAMAGCGSYSKVEGFAFLPITCFAMALTTFIGQNLGARKYDRAKQGAKFGILSSIILAEVIGVLIYVSAPFLIAMFNDNANVVAIGVRQARVEALFYCLLAFSHCIAGVCRGAGKAIIPMMIMLSIWCVLRIIYITVAMHFNHNIEFLFWAYPLTWTISSIIYLIYYKKSDWIHGFDAA
ncbi:multi antimicrobial extrusion protein (Na(+)/drug antiporter), MATE family of MDR efflux pumps [Lachnospiraceae bacterium KM106-2]|nr:multi antimicrobial extrusion protein (Na(+)/drug antiporter), MATE family of MDR efflux pumps [Lachnospiraceae bacterium KM106-2]